MFFQMFEVRFHDLSFWLQFFYDVVYGLMMKQNRHFVWFKSCFVFSFFTSASSPEFRGHRRPFRRSRMEFVPHEWMNAPGEHLLVCLKSPSDFREFLHF